MYRLDDLYQNDNELKGVIRWKKMMNLQNLQLENLSDVYRRGMMPDELNNP